MEMTVKRLIELLSKFDGNYPVRVAAGDHGSWAVEHIVTVTLFDKDFDVVIDDKDEGEKELYDKTPYRCVVLRG